MHVAQNLHFNLKGILFLFHDDCFCLKGKPLIFQQNLFVKITPQKTCQCRMKEAFQSPTINASSITFIIYAGGYLLSI